MKQFLYLPPQDQSSKKDTLIKLNKQKDAKIMKYHISDDFENLVVLRWNLTQIRQILLEL